MYSHMVCEGGRPCERWYVGGHICSSIISYISPHDVALRSRDETWADQRDRAREQTKRDVGEITS